MSKYFTVDFVTSLADDKKIRLPRDKVKEFLACLEAGEQAYFNAIAQEERVDELKTLRAELEPLMPLLNKARRGIKALSPTAIDDLAWVAVTHTHTPRWVSAPFEFGEGEGYGDWLKPVKDNIRHDLTTIAEGLRDFCKVMNESLFYFEFKAGRPKRGKASKVSISALEQMVTVIKDFWQKELGLSFSEGFISDWPEGDDNVHPDKGVLCSSTAADFLVLRCVQQLDPRATAENCRTIMRNLKKVRKAQPSKKKAKKRSQRKSGKK